MAVRKSWFKIHFYTIYLFISYEYIKSDNKYQNRLVSLVQILLLNLLQIYLLYPQSEPNIRYHTLNYVAKIH